MDAAASGARAVLADRLLARWLSDLATTAGCAGALAWWSSFALGAISLRAVASCLALVLLARLAGEVVLGALRIDDASRGYVDAAAALLVGLVALNLALLGAALLLPWRIGVDAALVGAMVLVARGIMGARAPGRMLPVRASVASLAALAVSLAAATLWSSSALPAFVGTGEATIFRPWTDAFYHATWLSRLRDAPDLAHLGNNLLDRAPFSYFPFGSYALPAALSALASIPSVAAIASLWIPMGVLVSGLAAFVLVRSWWGELAGLGGAAAVLLLPDGSYYGLANPALGYHWILQVSSASAWGDALGALALCSTMAGCRQQRLTPIAAGWALAGTLALFKVQAFVAAGALVVLYPAFFTCGWPMRRRWPVLAAAGLLVVLGAAVLGGAIPVPVLRLDGSGARDFLRSMLTDQPAGFWRDAFSGLAADTAPLALLAQGSAYLGLAVLGIGGVAALLVLVPSCWRRSGRAGEALLPVLVLLLFVVFSLGFAPNRSGSHTADAMLHRQLPWAYFVIAAWVGGQVFTRLDAYSGRRRGAGALAAGALLLGGLVFVAHAGRDAQRRTQWAGEFADRAFPAGLVASALYLREHSPPGAVIQDSRGDATLLVTALSERRSWLAEPLLVDFRRVTPELYAERRLSLERLRGLSDEQQLRALARSLGLDFFVLHPGDDVAWPQGFLEQAPFASGGYRVLRF